MKPESPMAQLPETARDVRCTHCQSAAVTLISLFGGSVSECLFRCDTCKSFFHWVKWR